MIIAFIKRGQPTDQGTEGHFSIPVLGLSLFSMELPWKGNQSRISCISPGDYTVVIRKSPKYGFIFHVTNVEGRSFILVHWGNFGGDVSKGFKSHTMGCILFGKQRGIMAGQRAVLNSRLAISEFMRALKNEPFKLIIS